MNDREPLVLGGLVTLLLVLWLGFVLHDDPRFAGSPWGGALGVSGAVLMVASLAYSLVKRVRVVRAWATRRRSMSNVLAWHMYTGLAGAILGLVHTGHKFDSPLGIALTAVSLIVVLSGYVGRRLMKRISLDIHEKRAVLTGLELAYRQTSGELAAHPEQTATLGPLARLWPSLWASFVPMATSVSWPALPAALRALRLADSIAELEYAVAVHEALKRRSAIWLDVHIVTAVMLYILLALHVWAGVYFGLRWWP